MAKPTPKHGPLNISGGHSSTFSDHTVDGRDLSHNDLSDILKDGYINSLWNKRRGGVVAVDWVVEPASDSTVDKTASEFVESTLKALNFDRICYKMLSALWYGYAFAQIVWEKQGDRFSIADIKVHDATKFKYDSFKKRWIMGADEQAIPENKFWLFTAMGENDDIPYGRGLGLDVHLAWYLRKHGWKFWAEYLEKFGSPSLIGKLPQDANAGADNQKELLSFQQALENLHSLGWAILPSGYETDVLNTGSGKSNHEMFMDKWDSILPQIILGQTMTTADGSSQAQAIVHKDVQDEIIQKDADLLCESFNNTVIKWLCQFNYPNATPPKIWRKIAKGEDLSARAMRDKIIAEATGLKPTKSYVMDTYGGEWEDRIENQALNTSNPSFAETDENKNKEQQQAPNQDIYDDPIYDDLTGIYEDINPYTFFIEEVLNKYDNLEDLHDNWADIEQQFMNSPDLLDLAENLKNALATSMLNGVLKTDSHLKMGNKK